MKSFIFLFLAVNLFNSGSAVSNIYHRNSVQPSGSHGSNDGYSLPNVNSINSQYINPSPSQDFDELPSSNAPGNQDIFLPFGWEANDQYIANGDDVFDCFAVSTSFPLFVKKGYNFVCINSDGEITVSKSNSGRQDGPVLLLYQLDLDNSQGRHITYRNTRNQATLRMINSNIALTHGKSGYPSNFKAEEAIIVTYNEIPKYGQRNIRFTFQAVIATDYNNTIAILNYKKLDQNGVVGHFDPYCTNAKQVSNLSNTDLQRTSNVGVRGKHIILLSPKGCIGRDVSSNYNLPESVQPSHSYESFESHNIHNSDIDVPFSVHASRSHGVEEHHSIQGSEFVIRNSVEPSQSHGSYESQYIHNSGIDVPFSVHASRSYGSNQGYSVTKVSSIKSQPTHPSPSQDVVLASSFIQIPLYHEDRIFMPYGPFHGDIYTAKGDDVSSCFPVSPHFVLFAKNNHRQICINSNGYLTVDQQRNVVTSPDSRYPALAVFNIDLVNNGYNILYRTTQDQQTLDLIDQDIAPALGHTYDDDFKAREAIIVTYNHIPKYGNYNIRYHFQVVIATDFTHTFVILNYYDLDSSAGKVGFHDTDCHQRTYFQRSYNSGPKRNLDRNSNVGVTGRFVYKLTECRWYF